MNDDMADLAPALLMIFIIAIGFVAFEFRSVYLAQQAQTVAAGVEKPRLAKAVPKTNPKLAMDNRLYWIR